MGFFGKLVKGALDVALLPVDIVRDSVTLGGVLEDKNEPNTVTRLRKIVEDVEDAGDDAGDGDWL